MYNKLIIVDNIVSGPFNIIDDAYEEQERLLNEGENFNGDIIIAKKTIGG